MSLGKDLASIRKNQNLTLEDIQNAIKIPLTTLNSIENESIFADLGNNRAYIRSFVRSYAKALKLDDEQIVQALDEIEAGTYTGASLFGEDLSAREDSQQNEPKAAEPADKEAEPTASSQKEEPESAEQDNTESPAQKKETDSDQESINWADLSRQFGTPGKSVSRTWIAIIVIVLMLALGGTGVYFWFFSSDSSEPAPVEMEETTQIDDTDNLQQNTPPPITADSSVTEPEVTVQEEESDAPVTEPPVVESTEITKLDDTLTLSVYAAYGQLEPVRITSDLNWRTNPFWMEQGEAYYFDFNDTLLVRGQYSRLLLLFNGHIIENPRQNNFDTSFNSIMITRNVLNNPKYLAPASSEFPLDVGAPDSIIYRIRL